MYLVQKMSSVIRTHTLQAAYKCRKGLKKIYAQGVPCTYIVAREKLFWDHCMSPGVVHTWIKTKEGNKICIHNDYFNTHPVEIVTKSVVSENASGDIQVALKYW
jgi:hypothetical protein